ncbi:MAG: hypothetical protein AA931_01745 [Peptococcaceae bacterium 1109]|nr:MAG: hypothetical protein AA931_01745 [Peptococcaceae bacterium 1109]
MTKRCRGCGANLQTENPGEYGYIPPKRLGETDDDDLVCQRCFRIIHYNKDELGPVLATASSQALEEGVAWSDHVALVVDLLDFDAGLPSALLESVSARPLLVVANKQDLLPKKTTAAEVALWAKNRLRQLGVEAEVQVVSALNGFGFAGLAQWIEARQPKLLFAGVTNVGKSHVLSRLLGMRLGRKQQYAVKPTVSAYPGTTVSWSRWWLSGGIELADSPGFVPEGRLSDMLCPACARELIPSRTLSSKLYPIAPGQMMHIPGRATVVCQESTPGALLIGYCGSGVSWEKSSERHLAKWTREFDGHCPIQNWEEHTVTVPRNCDLIIHGLGWISARKGEYKLKGYLPAGTKFSLRPCLIGPKQQ